MALHTDDKIDFDSVDFVDSIGDRIEFDSVACVYEA